MRVLGLAFDFHDASAALIEDGQVIAAAAEERFSRNKHDAHFPRMAIDFCLEKGNTRAEDLDAVVLYEDPAKKWWRILRSNFQNYPAHAGEFIESQRAWLGKKLWAEALVTAKLGIPAEKLHKVGHHESHAAQAFLGSGFASSAVLTIDAVGETTTTGIFRASWGADARPIFEKVLEVEYPHSLGLFYSAMTAFLGFKPMNDECTLMALAAFGRPIHLAKLRRVVRATPEGFELFPGYFNFDRFLSAPWEPALVELLGAPRAGEPLSFSSLEDRAVSVEEQRFADLAASVQALFEELVLHLANLAAQRTGEKNLCYAGGAALNCVANTRLLRESGFARVHIPVEPGDGGASVGAALLGYYRLAPAPAATRPYPVGLGARPAAAALEDLLERLDLPHLLEYRKLGSTETRDRWHWERRTAETLASAIAAHVMQGRVVALMNEGFELGPRALGHRSILFRPDDPALALRVSREIKDRAPFRPYALSMTEEAAEELLEQDGLRGQKPLEWMQLAVAVRAERRASVRAGLHRDGTTRPQVVQPTSNKLLHAILDASRRAGGTGALINTSFNEAGYPIVGTPIEALHFFARTAIDVLVVGDLIIEKWKEDAP